MAGGLLGDWEGKLSKLIALANGIAGKKLNGVMIERAKKVIDSQMKREFKRAVGPDGSGWPLAKTGGFPLHGAQSKTLLPSRYSFVDAGVRVIFGFSARQAAALNKGWRRGGKSFPARKLVPSGDLLGPVWGPRLLGALRQLLRQMADLKALPPVGSEPSE